MNSTYHLIHGKECIDVEDVAPPVVWAIFVVLCWCFENGMMMEVFHDNFDEKQYIHVR